MIGFIIDWLNIEVQRKLSVPMLATKLLFEAVLI